MVYLPAVCVGKLSRSYLRNTKSLGTFFSGVTRSVYIFSVAHVTMMFPIQNEVFLLIIIRDFYMDYNVIVNSNI